MAKTHSPLWCLRAWQSCGESAVSFWCGSAGSGVFRRERDYTQLERYYEPFNPQTSSQQVGRSMVAYAVASWQGIFEEDQASWNYYQDYRRRRPVMSGYNLFISKFLLSGGNPKIPPSGRKEDESGIDWSFPKGEGGYTLILKSGLSNSPKATEKQVNFATAFPTVPRVVLTDWNSVDVWLTEVTEAHFKWDNDSKGPDVYIDWLATNAANA